jgi:hypothetical protein
LRTTFYTCCNKKYEEFIPIFAHSIICHNPDADVEIGVENVILPVDIQKCLTYIREKYPNNKLNIVAADFNDIKINGRSFYICPNIVRFITVPTIINEYVYISDVDIITLQKNIMDIHVKDMADSKLAYSNIVRPVVNGIKRMTGLHFTKWNEIYPIPDYTDFILNGMTGHDEVFLYNIVKRRTAINESSTFRPVHGIHMSPNRTNVKEWGLSKWKTEWCTYRNSAEFLYLETMFSTNIKNNIAKIDEFHGTGTEKIFTNIYLNNSWKGRESKSGPGASINATRQFLFLLESFIEEYNIRSVTDIGCGDFNWMKNFKFEQIDKYVGIDIVQPLISSNIEKYGNDKISFKYMDLTVELLEKTDLILCKDVLFHMSYNDALKVIDNIKNSKSAYFAATTFYDWNNHDIKTGAWRPINLETEPFNMKNPIRYYKNIENKTEGWVTKSMAIWKIGEKNVSSNCNQY